VVTHSVEVQLASLVFDRSCNSWIDGLYGFGIHIFSISLYVHMETKEKGSHMATVGPDSSNNLR
jgi:hypothetical protein